MDIQVFVNGLSLGAFYCLVAIGVSLIFGVMKVFNLAHGELVMVGGYAGWLVMSSGINAPPLLLFFLAIMAAIAAVVGLSLVIERGVFRPLRGTRTRAFTASVGIIYILQVSFRMIFGQKTVAYPIVFPGTVELLGGSLAMERLAIIIVSIILIGGLWFFLERTNLGRGLRATSQDSEAATLQGISTNRTTMLAWGIAGAFAAVAGAAGVRVVSLNPYMGAGIIWTVVIAVIVGGGGSIGGTIVMTFLLGFLNSAMFALGEPQLIPIINVLLMLVILAVRPQGLLGRER